MSVPFQKTIFESRKLKLMVNFSRITNHGCNKAEDIRLEFYAYDTESMRPIFSETLNYKQTQVLYDHLNSIPFIRDSSANTTCEFIELDAVTQGCLEVLEAPDVEALKTILSKASSQAKIILILQALSDDEVVSLEASIQHSKYSKAITHLSELISYDAEDLLVSSIAKDDVLKVYSAGKPELILQKWLESNLWTLGIEYIKSHKSKSIGVSSIADFVMETNDGYLDLIEIKRSKFKLFKFDSGHKCYFPSRELSNVIGQCLKYSMVLDIYKNKIEQEKGISVLKPRIKVIIGRSKDFNQDEKDALRLLNSSLGYLQILTYDDIIEYGNNIIKYYQSENRR